MQLELCLEVAGTADSILRVCCVVLTLLPITRYRQGEHGEPALYFELRVNSPFGQQTVLVSDGSWSVSQGPILSDSVYNGEIYDARFVSQPPHNLALPFLTRGPPGSNNLGGTVQDSRAIGPMLRWWLDRRASSAHR